MPEPSNVRFLLGARIENPTADILAFTFQRDSLDRDPYTVHVPRQLRRQLGREAFIDYVADYYLQLQPAEVTRIGRGLVIYTLTHSVH